MIRKTKEGYRVLSRREKISASRTRVRQKRKKRLRQVDLFKHRKG